MTEKHLNFLDYLLPRLSKCPDGEFIDSIAYEYEKESGISFDTDEIDHFESLYEYQYFTFPYSNLNRTAKITPETKEIIDTYGSLSKYLISLSQQNTKAIKRKNWITISPIIINVILLIVTIVFGILSIKLNNDVNALKKEITTKDSIILELNNKLTIIDSLREK